jgi:hypothetical protein
MLALLGLSVRAGAILVMGVARMWYSLTLDSPTVMSEG